MGGRGMKRWKVKYAYEYTLVTYAGNTTRTDCDLCVIECRRDRIKEAVKKRFNSNNTRGYNPRNLMILDVEEIPKKCVDEAACTKYEM